MVKKVMVLGAMGMAGHMMSVYLKQFPDRYDVFEVSRNGEGHFNVDIEKDPSPLLDAINNYGPDVVINCIGLLVKESQEEPAKAILINSLFPHALENCLKNTPIKIIHLSTDCIFDGLNSSGYYEDDFPTEKNWYGRTKALGEINNDKDLTLRMSIIGPELSRKSGLFEWFMAQKKACNGYTEVLWNGVTTLELAKQIAKILDTNLTGIYHLAPDSKISKYNLLTGISEIFNKNIEIIRDNSVTSNKTLINTRKDEYIPCIPSYREQLQELKNFISVKK